jgi:hypothetical protein
MNTVKTQKIQVCITVFSEVRSFESAHLMNAMIRNLKEQGGENCSSEAEIISNYEGSRFENSHQSKSGKNHNFSHGRAGR